MSVGISDCTISSLARSEGESDSRSLRVVEAPEGSSRKGRENWERNDEGAACREWCCDDDVGDDCWGCWPVADDWDVELDGFASASWKSCRNLAISASSLEPFGCCCVGGFVEDWASFGCGEELLGATLGE